MLLILTVDVMEQRLSENEYNSLSQSHEISTYIR